MRKRKLKVAAGPSTRRRLAQTGAGEDAALVHQEQKQARAVRLRMKRKAKTRDAGHVRGKQF